MKLLVPSDSYPDKYWLSYDHQNSIDHLAFIECKKLSVTNEICSFLLKSKVGLSAFRKYDYLFSDGPDLVSSRFARVIMDSNLANDIQLIASEVSVNGEIYTDYFVINYLKMENGFDMERCMYKPLIKSMPDGPKKFSRIVLLKKIPENSIFRAVESNSHIIFSDRVSEIVRSNSLVGIDFADGKDDF